MFAHCRALMISFVAALALTGAATAAAAAAAAPASTPCPMCWTSGAGPTGSANPANSAG